MKAVAARRRAARALEWLVRRMRGRFPAGSESSLVAVFDAAQEEAVARSGWPGLLRCWASEAASVVRLWWRGPAPVTTADTVAPPGAGLVSCFWHDVRDARRSLLRAPGYAAFVVVTLALGIGANTAIFSLVDALLFKPLPYQDPDRLVFVAERHPNGSRNTVAPANFLDWQTMARSFEGLEARHAGSFSLAIGAGGPPVQVRGARVTTGYFDLLGVRAALGRTFVATDGAPGAPCTAVLSHRLWVSFVGEDPSVLGRSIRLAGGPCTVIGVLGANSVFDRATADVYSPLALVPGEATRTSHFLSVVGRLRPGVTLDRARVEMVDIAATLHRANPGSSVEWSAAVDPMRTIIVRTDSRHLVWVLFGAVAVVLLVACVNVAGLALARGAVRRREVAVRMSLGAGRWRVIRHLTVESLVLAGLGASLGLVVGAWVLRAADTVLPPNALPAEAVATLDWRALGFTAFVAVLAALVCGLMPAWQTARASVVDALRDTSRGASGSRALGRIQSTLVVIEVALATMLVAGATLLVVSFAKLTGVDPGFSAERLLTFQLSLPADRYGTGPAVMDFYERTIDAVERVGGVESAAGITSLPLGGWLYGTIFSVDGEPFDAAKPPAAHIQHVVGRYFETMGIPVLQGRGLTRADTGGTPPVVVVNQTFARRYLGAEPWIGKRIHLGEPTTPTWSVVGVIRNVKTASLSDGDLEIPEIYVSHLQMPAAPLYIAVRTRGAEPLRVVPDVRAAVAAIDEDVPLGDVGRMTDRVGSSVTLERFQTSVMAAFAALTLLIACLGVYAVRSQAVASRTREVGIRVALGATASQVLALMIGQGVRLIGVGLVAGLVGALLAAGAIRQWLFDTAETDPLGLTITAVVIAAAALGASWLPARRAARLDPMVTLKAD